MGQGSGSSRGGQTLGAFLSQGLAYAGYRVAVANLHGEHVRQVAEELDEQVKQYCIDKVPLKRGCDYQNVLNTLLFYDSDKASYCTDQSINITGGQVMF